MILNELNHKQRLQLKESILIEKNEDVSLGELLDADTLISDDELEERFGGINFVEEDFFCC